MNQILYTENIKNRKKYVKKFRFQFFISLTLIILFTIYLLYFYNSKTKEETISDALLNRFNIERLYSKNEDYTIVELNQNSNYFIIGIVEIPKLNINYPILSDVSDELLKISACRFYGPYPNEIGNLCIAAHNYDDNRFFGNLYKLEIGDKINIYDSTNSLIIYYVYDKYETDKNDTTCTSQNTYGKKEITLITCNNLNGNRLIIKAKE